MSRVEDELRKVTRRLTEAEALGHVGTWELDADSGELYSSAENRRLFFGADSLKGGGAEDYFDAVHPEDREWVMKRNSEFLAGIGSPEIEFRVIWPDGSVHWILGSKQMVRDAAGKYLRQIGTNADITSRKRAELELRSQREQLAALSRRLIDAQEAERRTVARELHDDLGQVLTAIKLNLMRQERDRDETVALVDRAIERMRDLARDLRPAILDDFGLAAALRWYVEREAQRAGLDFHLTLSVETRLPASVETSCFRVVQEAITNVARHAEARRIDVELSASGSGLLLTVRDDGKGFDVTAARQRAGRGESQGLSSMQERITLAGGAFEIESAPGRGTTIRARFPVEAVR